MRTISTRSKRIVLLLGLFAASFGLYAAAESGTQAVEIVLLAALSALMLVAVWLG